MTSEEDVFKMLAASAMHLPSDGRGWSTALLRSDIGIFMSLGN